VLGAGLEIINKICEFAPVIADFKVADIPNTDRLICSQTFEAGRKARLSCMVLQGGTAFWNCVRTAKEFNGDIFVVAEMSHPGAVEFMQPKALELASLGRRMQSNRCGRTCNAP